MMPMIFGGGVEVGYFHLYDQENLGFVLVFTCKLRLKQIMLLSFRLMKMLSTKKTYPKFENEQLRLTRSEPEPLVFEFWVLSA